MLRGDAHDSLCTRLAHTGYLVEEDECEFIVLVGYLDHVAIDRIES